MRRPTFKRWIAKEIQYLSGVDSLDLVRLASLAQGTCPRIIEPLLLYAMESSKEQRLLGLIWRSDIKASYKSSLVALEECGSLQALALGDRYPRGLPREYTKYFSSYRAAYYKPETDAASKRMRWKQSRELQLKKGVHTSEIYTELKLNPGNVNAYMKHGAVEKVSLQHATEIMRFLFAY